MKRHSEFYKGHIIEVSQESRRGVWDDWYIQVTAPDGTYAYDGWWNDSRDKTVDEAIAEAKAGAMIDEPLQAATGGGDSHGV